jgi:hypothetical protein
MALTFGDRVYVQNLGAGAIISQHHQFNDHWYIAFDDGFIGAYRWVHDNIVYYNTYCVGEQRIKAEEIETPVTKHQRLLNKINFLKEKQDD